MLTGPTTRHREGQMTKNQTLRNQYNGIRFNPANLGGHYESYFLRANHPQTSQAFWIRYTIFSPRGNPSGNIGEIWVIYFDGEKDQVIAAKEEIPFEECGFGIHKLEAHIGKSWLKDGCLQGQTSSNDNIIEWDLCYEGDNEPVLLLPKHLYNAPLPKAKSVTGNPNVLFTGSLKINGETIEITNWQGSENHNWGNKHTDNYAWGQVAGFDNDPDAFLECITASVKIGPVRSPWLTIIYLRLDGRNITLNLPMDAIKAQSRFNYFDWNFSSQNSQIKVTGRIRAPKKHVVGLNYYNPPKGSNTCLNSKIASCDLKIEEKGKPDRNLTTDNRAAFEILTTSNNHGVPVVA